VLLALPATAAEPPPSSGQPTEPADSAPTPPAPSREQALALTQELLDQVRAGGPDLDWLAAHLHPPSLPAGPSPAWLERWAERLDPAGRLGERLARATPIAAVQGPGYQRVLIEAAPGLSVRIVATPDGPRIAELAWTTCTLCTERVRFVADLLHDVQRRGSGAHRLLPGVELDLSAHHEQRGVDSDWIGVLSLRNGQAGYLARTLRGARGAGAQGPVVRVRYADGSLDTWAVHWAGTHWTVDYASLHADSPLRMSRAESRSWERTSTRAATARQAWRPRFTPVGGGAGVELGHEAIDAWPDPRDGTVLVIVLDVDRVLTAVFRVDPATRQVVDRLRAPLADARTQLPLDDWGERWPTALSVDGRLLALSAPNRLWLLDLGTRQSRLLGRGEITWLAFDPEPDPGLWSARGRTLIYRDSQGLQARERHDSDVVGLVPDADGTWRLTAGGALADPSGAIVDGPAICCGQVVDTATDPSGTRTLASCGATCDTAAVWLEGTQASPIDGAGSDHTGASCSPDARWFTTGTPQGLLLWSRDQRRPVARIPSGPVRAARWSPDGAHVLTIGEDGRVIWWDLDRLLAEHAV